MYRCLNNEYRELHVIDIVTVEEAIVKTDKTH